ncbi:MAG: hypothetical protein V3T49_03465 [Dehalococcoidia bacterium]
MNVFKRQITIVVGLVIVSAVIAGAVYLSGSGTKAVINTSVFPMCDSVTPTAIETPCAIIEKGALYAVWDGIKFRTGPAPTLVPVPYRAHSIHPDTLARALKEGIALSIEDYDEVYVGIVHDHYPLECDGDLFCSEAWYHRFDSGTYSSQFNDVGQMQKHGINYIKIDGEWYLDGADQFTGPTPVRATPTTPPTAETP